MTTRELFLGRLRNRLFAPPHENLPHPLVEVEGVPAIAYARPLDDLTAAFERSAREAGATVQRVATRDDLTSFVRAVVEASGARTVTRSRDPETEGLTDMLGDAGVEEIAFTSFTDAARADLGITGAAFGIAATGTLVLHPDRAGSRSASLLPPAHLALLRTENILPEAGAMFRRMHERFPDGPPSQLVLATGPSRTGDIELTLTTKVHGPGDVWIGLLE